MRVFSGPSVDKRAVNRSVDKVDKVDEVLSAKTAVSKVVVAIYCYL